MNLIYNPKGIAVKKLSTCISLNALAVSLSTILLMMPSACAKPNTTNSSSDHASNTVVTDSDHQKLGAILVSNLQGELNKLQLPVIIKTGKLSEHEIQKLATNLNADYIDGNNIYATVTYIQLKQLQKNAQVVAIDAQGRASNNPPNEPPLNPQSTIGLEENNNIITQSNTLPSHKNFIENLQLFSVINQHHPTQNFSYSLHSIEQAFLAALMGVDDPLNVARPDWLLPKRTQNNLIQPSVTLPSSYQNYNQFFYHQGQKVNKNFIKNYQQALSGKLLPLNFAQADQASKQANNILKQQTHGLIDALFQPNDFQQSDAIISNILHFKASWQSAFDSSQTKIAKFTNYKGEVQQVPTMQQQIQLSTSQMGGWQYLSIPFAEQSRLHIFMTPQGQTNAELSLQTAQQLMSQAKETNVYLKIPKLVLVGDTIDLNALIPQMTDWRFTNLIDNKTLKNPQAKHKAIVSWDESGAQAAAATTIVSKRALSPEIEVNRPFVFMISHNEQMMFTGMVRQL